MKAFSQRILYAGFALALTLSLFTACKPDGFINKVKYQGAKYTNTCDTFAMHVEKVIKTNSDSAMLPVSLYDNSAYNYFFLEPGQYDIRKDTLYFRLRQDIKYDRYVAKGVAVHVTLTSRAVERLREHEEIIEQLVGTLVVDQTYLTKNRKPFFVYKYALKGAPIEGKQLYLSFAIAKYDLKTGKVANFFCSTDTKPIGVAKPACCTADRWAGASLQTKLAFPDFTAQGEKYRHYSGFSGTIDIAFKEGDFSYSDSLMSSAIQSYIEKYTKLGYTPTSVRIEGFASPGGAEAENIALSQKRAEVVANAIKKYNAGNKGLEVKFEGRGEDWIRVYQLTQTSTVLSAAQKAEIVAIVNDTIANDAKEAKLRKLAYWDQFSTEIFTQARHTFTWIDFKLAENTPTFERFGQILPLNSPELEKAAKTTYEVRPYYEGANPKKELDAINDLMRRKATANLYLMRATYARAAKDYTRMYEDLLKAHELDAAKGYDKIVDAYKFALIDTYSFAEKVAMMQALTKYCAANPADKAAALRRALVMTKIGLLDAAVREYLRLMENYDGSAEDYLHQGIALLKSNRFVEAELSFLKATEKNNKLAEAYLGLASLYAYQGLTEKTEEMLDAALEIQPAYKQLIQTSPAFSIMRDYPSFAKYKK